MKFLIFFWNYVLYFLLDKVLDEIQSCMEGSAYVMPGGQWLGWPAPIQCHLHRAFGIFCACFLLALFFITPLSVFLKQNFVALLFLVSCGVG
jgi:hypothetical protein